nr:zinc finger protein 665-like [Procambarus clarkii]
MVVVVMGSIGTQTEGLVPSSLGAFVFISTIKNEDACTQCWLPLTCDVSTSTDELATYIQSFIDKNKNCESSGTGKRRGRPRKPLVVTADSSGETSSSILYKKLKIESKDEFVHTRIKRERKIPVKFDPSDVCKTKATSIPASKFNIRSEIEEIENINENVRLLDSDSDWTDEESANNKICDTNDNTNGMCEVPDCTNNKCANMKCFQNNWTDKVIHEELDKEKKGESEYTVYENKHKMNVVSNNADDKGKASCINVKVCKRKRMLNYHENKGHSKRKHAGGGPYTCEQCHVDFKLISIYSKHMLNHEIAEGKHSVKCKLCGKVLSSHVNLRRHMMIHTGKPFTCEICGKGFTGRYLLREHLAVEHDQISSNTQSPTNHQCRECKKYMSTRTALQYHQAQLHPCMKCNRKFSCRTGLREHVLQVHDHVSVTKGGRLVCVQCNKSFNYRHHYLNHVAHHSDEKTHKCQKCKKGFLTSQALYCHTKQVHEKYNYRYPCETCEKVFICNAKLVEHVRTHTGEKPFECGICSVAFAAKATYKSHMKLVHSQTPKQRWKKSKDMPVLYMYNCPLCDIKDLKADELEDHCWNIHNATVQFSHEVPEKLSPQETRALDGSKSIILSKGNANLSTLEGSKEILLSEGSNEIVVSDRSTEILLREGSTEIMVSEETSSLQLLVNEENASKSVSSAVQDSDTQTA